GELATGIPPVREELLGEHLEQRLALHGRDRVLALRPVVAEARPLAAGDEEGAYLALAEELPAAGGGVAVELALLVVARNAGVDRDRLDVLGQVRVGLAAHVLLRQPVDVAQVQRRELRREAFAGGGVESVDEP